MSIQSLLNEKPFHNEPGFAVERVGWEVKSYNDIIRHETVRVAVCDVLERSSYASELMYDNLISIFSFFPSGKLLGVPFWNFMNITFRRLNDVRVTLMGSQ